MRPSVRSPTGTEIGAAGVGDRGAAGEAVRGVEGHGAHPVVTQVLLHLGHQRRAVRAAVDLDGVVDARQPVREVGVDDHPLDLDDGARAASVVCHVSGSLLGDGGAYWRASAPPTTSRISWVMAAWRARFMASVQVVDELAGVVGGVAHRGASRRELGGRALEQGAVDGGVEEGREQRLQEVLRVGLEEREAAAGRGRLVLLAVVVRRRARRAAATGSSCSVVTFCSSTDLKAL